MTLKTVRKVVTIDEEKCNGCGACAHRCVEAAIEIIDGKAKLISEKYCDGLGACLGECPHDAISIEERAVEDFDEEAVKIHLVARQDEKEALGGCTSIAVQQFERPTITHSNRQESQPSMLSQWPVQLTLVPAQAPFLQNADIMLVADCVPFSYPGFHRDFLAEHSLLVACPKLDDFAAHQSKLTQILRESKIKSLTVVHMEVPCCFGLVHMAQQALQSSGQNIPFKEITIGIHGEQQV